MIGFSSIIISSEGKSIHSMRFSQTQKSIQDFISSILGLSIGSSRIDLYRITLAEMISHN